MSEVFNEIELDGLCPDNCICDPGHSSDFVNILNQALDIVNARKKIYGDPKQFFEKISKMWSAYLDIPVTAIDVSQLMIMYKVARGYNGYSAENFIDIAGYALCAQMINDKKDG